MAESDAEQERQTDAGFEVRGFGTSLARHLDTLTEKAQALLRDLDPTHPTYATLGRLAGALQLALGEAQTLHDIVEGPPAQPPAEPVPEPSHPPGNAWATLPDGTPATLFTPEYPE
jgi:hypothetical protein